jgi:hypothetical protein
MFIKLGTSVGAAAVDFNVAAGVDKRPIAKSRPGLPPL